MHLIKYILVFFIFINICFADQNDRRLDSLFNLLKNSSDYEEIYKTTNKIWTIWLQTNDSNIKEDFNKGLQFMELGYYQESITMFTKVINKNSNFAEAWNKRATAYFIIGNFNASINDIKEVLVREPRHFGAIDGLCAIFMQMKEYEKAAKAYKEMLKIFPNDIVVKKKYNNIVALFSKSI